MDINLQATHISSGSLLLDRASNMNSSSGKISVGMHINHISHHDYLQCQPSAAPFHTQDGV